MGRHTAAWSAAYFLLVVIFGSWNSMWLHAATVEGSPWWNFWVQGRWAWVALALLLPAPRLFSARWEDLGPGLLWLAVLAVAQWSRLVPMEWLHAFALAQVIAALLRTAVQKSLIRASVATPVFLFVATLLHFILLRDLETSLRLNVWSFAMIAVGWFHLPPQRMGTGPIPLHPAWSLGGSPFGPGWSRRTRRCLEGPEQEMLWLRGVRFAGAAVLVWMAILWGAPWLKDVPPLMGLVLWLSLQFFVSGALALMGYLHAPPMVEPWKARSPLDLLRRLDFWTWQWSRRVFGPLLRRIQTPWLSPQAPVALIAAVLTGLSAHNPWRYWLGFALFMVLADAIARAGRRLFPTNEQDR